MNAIGAIIVVAIIAVVIIAMVTNSANLFEWT